MVEVIWYFSLGLGVVTSSGRIEWGGKERREERELRMQGKERQRTQEKGREKKDGGTWRTLGDEGERVKYLAERLPGKGNIPCQVFKDDVYLVDSEGGGGAGDEMREEARPGR